MSFRNKAVVGDWEEAKNLLGEETAAVVMEDNGELKEGDLKVIDYDPGIPATFFEPDIVEDDYIERDSRVGEGFYSLNSRGEPVEIKYRFPKELREYPEQIHMHNTPELYIPMGEFTISLASVIQDDYPVKFEEITLDEPLIVPSGMYHGIQEREEESGLIVARGDPTGEEEYVGKWDLNKNQLYGHIEEPIQTPKLTSYHSKDDELYRL